MSRFVVAVAVGTALVAGVAGSKGSIPVTHIFVAPATSNMANQHAVGAVVEVLGSADFEVCPRDASVSYGALCHEHREWKRLASREVAIAHSEAQAAEYAYRLLATRHGDENASRILNAVGLQFTPSASSAA